MSSIFNFFASMWNNIVNLLDNYTFKFGAVSVGIFSIFLGFVAIALIVKVFWKGA